MHVDDVVARLDEGLARLGRFLNREDLGTELNAEAVRLSDALQERQTYLADCRRRVEVVLGRITDRRQREAALTEQVRQLLQSGDQGSAWQAALELDRISRELAAERAELTHLQAACLGCQAQIARLERELAAVQSRLYPDY